jgi:hypothetical protein
LSWTTKDFHGELQDGHSWAQKVANYLNAQGLDCTCTPISYAKTQAEIEVFTKTDKDITFNKMTGNLEVKSLRTEFTSPKDWPWQTAIVDTASGWKQKEEKPVAVILVSKITGAMIAVPVSTEHEWKVERRFDSLRKFEDNFLMVSRRHLRTIDELVVWLIERQRKTNELD